MSVTEDVIKVLKNNYIALNVTKGDRSKPYSTTALDMDDCVIYQYQKMFEFNSKIYIIAMNYYYFDMEYQSINYKSEHFDYFVLENETYSDDYLSPNSPKHTLDDYIPRFDSDDQIFKEYILEEFKISAAPDRVYDFINDAKLSEGIREHNCSLDKENEIFEIITEFNILDHKDSYCIYMDKSWSDMEYFKGRNTYLERFIEVFDISFNKKVIELKEWVRDNCKGKVKVFGNSYSINILIFENKNDAMMYKMSFNG